MQCGAIKHAYNHGIFFPQRGSTHVGRLWTKLSLSSPQTRLDITIWALIADES